MSDNKKDKIEMKDIQEKKPDSDKNKEKNKESNVYFIFTIDKNNFDITQITFDLLYNTKKKI